MKLLGLIGGTSYHSTLVYYKQINEKVGEYIGKHSNPPLLLYSLNIDLMRLQNIERINSEYLKIAIKLQNAGAEAIVICANTPHMVYDYVQPQIDIPILHIADGIGTEAQSGKLHTLGLLGNLPTMTRGFIQKILSEKYQLNTIIPEKLFLEQTHNYVSRELTQGIFSDQAKHFFINQMELLKKKGADGIILGCTELPLLLNRTDIDLPLLSSTDLHVQMAVDFLLD